MIQFNLPNNTLAHTPAIHADSFIAPGVQLMGNVMVKKNASVWYNTVVRGDINRIEIGERSNIQDGCILHVENTLPCIVENDVTVGHHANLHGCHVEECCLIGIGAIVLSGARIGRGSIIGAGAVIKENSIIPPFSMVVGVPGTIIKSTPESTIESQKKWAQKYVELSKQHKLIQASNTTTHSM
jgi:carbonic anhydrase/acetyltransferase-like protein (isoleucine patch superfamily)